MTELGRPWLLAAWLTGTTPDCADGAGRRPAARMHAGRRCRSDMSFANIVSGYLTLVMANDNRLDRDGSAGASHTGPRGLVAR